MTAPTQAPQAKADPIDVTGRSPLELLVIAERACAALCRIANNLTSDEASVEDTEEELGLDFNEVCEMAHDGMIRNARATLDSIIKEFPKVKP